MTNSKTLSLLVSFVLVCVVGFAIADQAKEAGDKAHFGVTAIRSNGDIDTDGAVVATGAVASSSTLTGTEAVIDGKYAATGSDATTGLMIQIGTCTNGQTITFSPVFGATPRIVGNYTVDAGADTVIEFTSTTATSTVVAAASAKVIDYIAIGTRP